MAGITYQVGDATRPEGLGGKIIVHCCNDLGAWGAGFVAPLGRRYPTVRESYLTWAAGEYAAQDGADYGALLAPPFALGQVQFVPVEPNLIVGNMLAQHNVGPDERGRPPLRMGALNECLERVRVVALELGAHVYGPRFGAGLAAMGADPIQVWAEIAEIISRELVAYGVPVTIYDLPGQPFGQPSALFGGRKKRG